MPDKMKYETLRLPLFWVCLSVGLLGVYLYAPLFSPSAQQTLAVQGEHFFFEVNQAPAAPVLILALWLLYRRSHYRDVFRGPGEPIPAVCGLLVSAVFFGWGAYTKAPDLQLVSLIGLLLGVVLLFAGRAGLRAYWLPILFLGFALPISPVLLGAAMFPAQLVTAQFAGWILNSIGVEALVQGDQILRPENTFIVIETCSGLRTIVTLSMLTILMIDLFERRGRHAALLICVTPFIAFLANGLRVVTLVLNPHSQIHSVHILQGIVMLLVGLIMIYLVDGQIERVLSRSGADSDGPDYGWVRRDDSVRGKTLIHVVAIGALLILMFAFDRIVPTWDYVRGLEEKPDALLERVFGEDPAAPYPIDYKFRGSVHYLGEARHRVSLGGRPVEIYLGVAHEQYRGFSILTKRLAWPGSGYVPVDERFEDVVEGGPRARRMLLRRGSRRVLSYSWIERRGDLPTEWLRHALALDRSFLARPRHMLAIRISTSLGSGSEAELEADARIRRAWAKFVPELENYASIRTGP
jgi:exosortase